MADWLGQQLGNYRITRLLGRGGFADVYLGEHIYLKSQAALKVLRTSLQDKDAGRFLAEAQTLVRLRHPHIVRVLEFAVEQGTPVLVMDYAPGGIIRETYPRGSSLPLKVVVTYVQQLASALQYAHNHKVIHRDVKPENILLGPEQELLLSDFGLSLLMPSPDLLSTQEMAGTIPYMAPEQLHGKPVFASDQYALGVVTYEWLCGTRPFTGTLWEIAQQHLSVTPPPLREKSPALSVGVEDVVLKALAKEPQQRFVSVQAFAHAFARASQATMLEEGARTSLLVSARSEASLVTQPDQSLKRVFLAASPADEGFAIRLKADLEERGMLVEGTPSTPDREEELRQAIRAAQFILVVVSPHIRSSRTIKEYLGIASMYERQLVFVWAAGDDIAALLPEGWGKTAVIDLIDAREGRYALALHELVTCLGAEEALSITNPLESSLSQAGDKLPGPRNPYKGLHPFTKDDATDFFGRDALIHELVETMQGMLVPATSAPPGTTDARLLTVIGPSGSGKSSVVMAGLLPRLWSGALPGSEEWVYLDPIVPGQHPLEALILALSSHFPARSLTTIREDLQDDATRGLHLLAAALTQKPDTKVVLIVDQFEELFTQTTAEGERRRFIDPLLVAAAEPRGPLLVVCTLRADFYDRPMQYPELHRLMQRHLALVLPMEVDDLRATIEQPAGLPDVQLTLESNLVGDILYEMQGQRGALPLLQFTLEQLFERRDGYRLTLLAYREIGGVTGAIAQHAEQTYVTLPSEEHRRLARFLFLGLLDLGMTEQDVTRRRAALSEFALADATQTRLLRETMDAFVGARLLMTNEVGGIKTIEVCHEALLREWPRLVLWLREAHADLFLQRGIREDAATWARAGRSVDRLYRGEQLEEALVWRERALPSTEEEAFLQASIAERERQQGAVVKQQQQERRYKRRAVLIGLGVGVVGLGLTGTVIALGNLFRPASFHGHSDAVSSVAWSPDGGRLASGSYDGIAHIWDVATGAILLSTPQLTQDGNVGVVFIISSVAWSLDGLRLAAASEDHIVHIWDAATGKALLTYLGHSGEVTSVAWSPDGGRLASASTDTTVQVWLL